MAPRKASSLAISEAAPETGFVRFDLTPLPAGTTITQAFLRLYINDLMITGPAGTITILEGERPLDRERADQQDGPVDGASPGVQIFPQLGIPQFSPTSSRSSAG